MPQKILPFLLLALGLQNGMAQILISDSASADKDHHEIFCRLPSDNGSLSIVFSKDTVIAFQYSNRATDAGKCNVEADRHAPQGNYGPAPIWMDSSASLTKIKLLVYDGYDWSEQPVWVRIRNGKAPEIQFSGPTKTLCSGSAKVPGKILIRRSPDGWLCKIPVK